jgi:hypothetical protein
MSYVTAVSIILIASVIAAGATAVTVSRWPRFWPETATWRVLF